MKLEKENMKRLGIFFFYDEEGIVDDYVIYLLKNMEKFTTHNIVVCNGILNESGRKRFEQLPHTDILVRENVGFDVWAYKTALEYYGWDVIDTYDEIILYNFTIMGPVKSFDLMFEEMDREDIDFWGITVHHGAPFDPFGTMEDGKLPLHIQSHFIAVRKPMLISDAFHDYWDNHPMIHSYNEAVGLHEAIFTGIFEKLGYRWKVYVDTSDLQDDTYYPLFNMPVDLIKNRKCPIFKRKLFINDFEGTIQENANLSARELLEYLKKDTDYNTDMIWKHLLRSANMHNLVSGLNLRYVVDEDAADEKKCEDRKTAFFVSTASWKNYFINYMQKLQNVPARYPIYILVNQEKTSMMVQEMLADHKEVHIAVTNKNLFETFQEAMKAYNYVCILGEKKEKTVEKKMIPYTNVLAGQELTIRSMVESEIYIKNIEELFEKDKFLGMLSACFPVHGRYYSDVLSDWENNFQMVKKVAESERYHVHIHKEKPLAIAFDNCCWIRGKILKEYLKTREKILQSLEDKEGEIWPYVMPVLVQNCGYLATNVLSKAAAENLLNSFYQYTFIADKRYNCPNKNYLELLSNGALVEVISEIYYDKGEGFDIERVKSLRTYINPFEKNKVEFEIKVPEKVKYIRFDPCEGFMCICTNVTVNQKGVNLYNVNGIHLEKEDLFLTKDPQYILDGNFSNITTIKIKMDNMSVFWSENGFQKEIDGFYKQREEMVNAIEYLKNAYNDLKQEKLKEICRKEEENRGYQQKIEQYEIKINMLQTQVDQIVSSRGYCILEKFWKMKDWIRQKIHKFNTKE